MTHINEQLSALRARAIRLSPIDWELSSQDCFIVLCDVLIRSNEGSGLEPVTASEASTSLTSPANTRGGVRPIDPPTTDPQPSAPVALEQKCNAQYRGHGLMFFCEREWGHEGLHWCDTFAWSEKTRQPEPVEAWDKVRDQLLSLSHAVSMDRYSVHGTPASVILHEAAQLIEAGAALQPPAPPPVDGKRLRVIAASIDAWRDGGWADCNRLADWLDQLPGRAAE